MAQAPLNVEKVKKKKLKGPKFFFRVRAQCFGSCFAE
jgi:hypothetical protein